jgi:hypothetical protein
MECYITPKNAFQQEVPQVAGSANTLYDPRHRTSNLMLINANPASWMDMRIPQQDGIEPTSTTGGRSCEVSFGFARRMK